MRKILIFGNSGSGKSTFAKTLFRSDDLAHLDLDTLAWQPTVPPARKPLAESEKELFAFVESNNCWVIDGGYADLLNLAAAHANEIIFLNLPVEACIANAKTRPWEPHKYESKVAQDANLDMLVEWIADYYVRHDLFSKAAHNAFYNQFTGKKSMVTRHEKPLITIKESI